MARYILLRVGQALLVVWLAYTLTFFGIAALPSDPITIHLTQISGGGGSVDPNMVEAMKGYYGYQDPLLVRYFHQLGELAQGNYGYSLTASVPVLERIGQVIGSTLRLAGVAFLIAVLVTAVVVSVGSLARWGWIRRLARTLPTLFSAVPTFWLGILALTVLSFQLGVMSVFPDGSAISLIVPAAVLGIPLSAPLTQVTMKAVDQAYQQPFVDVARAKGAREGYVFVRHVVKNAGASSLTVLGLVFGQLITGTVVTETVFARSGIGRVLLGAVSVQDVALVQGFVLLSALVFVTINLLVDLAYPLLDPRVVTAPRRRLRLDAKAATA